MLVRVLVRVLVLLLDTESRDRDHFEDEFVVVRWDEVGYLPSTYQDIHGCSHNMSWVGTFQNKDNLDSSKDSHRDKVIRHPFPSDTCCYFPSVVLLVNCQWLKAWGQKGDTCLEIVIPGRKAYRT